MTWAQSERGYRPNLWKRISIHIKKKEEVNQTAIIKPFSKGADVPSDTGFKVEYEEAQQGAESYPPAGYNASTSPGVNLPTVSQRVRFPGGSQIGGEGEGALKHPPYLSELSQRAGSRGAGMTGVGPLSRGVGVGAGAVSRGMSVGAGGAMNVGEMAVGVGVIGNQPQGSTIMDQISCVVTRFTA